MPYAQGLQLLQGVNASAYALKGNAFVLNGGGIITKSNVVVSDTIKRDIVVSTSDYASNLKASADFDFTGWGAHV